MLNTAGIWWSVMCLAGAAAPLLSTPAAHAAGILFFVTSVDDHDDGACNADCTLREAINAANANPGDDDGIELGVTGIINLSSELPFITGGVSIDGPGAPLLTVRRNSDVEQYRVFTVATNATVAFSGLTISNGFLRGAGGGIGNFGTGTVNIRSISVMGNSAIRSSGGGIANADNGTVNVTNSTISENHADEGSGGGIANVGLGVLHVTDSNVSRNTAATGGGIGNRGVAIISNMSITDNQAGGGAGVANSVGTLLLMDSHVTNNQANDAGGGVINSNTGTTTVDRCTIADNRSRGGGGISNIGTGTVNIMSSTIHANDGGRASGGGLQNISTGVINLTNSTITNNSTVRGRGGGIANVDTGTVNVSNCTISGNSALDGDGGGLVNPGAGIMAVKSTIIALNAADFGRGPDVAGTFASQGFNLVGKSDESTGFSAATDLTGIIAVPLDPMLDPNGLQDNGGPTLTIALLCNGPAIDAASRIGLNGPLLLDQRAFFRTTDDPSIANAAGGDGTDIGAFEAAICIPTPTETPTSTATFSASTATLTATPTRSASATAVPTATCPLSHGYWKTHPTVWPVASLRLGSQTYSQAELLEILRKRVVGDVSVILSRQLTATKLNIANGSDPISINAAVTAADALLSSFSGRLPYDVKASSASGQVMATVAGRLDQYNSGQVCPHAD